MKKQIASILCLALIIVLLTACNRADKTEPTDPHKETQAAAVQTEQPTEITATQISEEPTAPAATQAIVSQTDEATEYEEPTEERSMALMMTIGDTPVSVAWEDSDAVEALRELCREKPLTIDMSMYGGFEQVGSIGTALPTADRQTTTSPGDIVLYSGDGITAEVRDESKAQPQIVRGKRIRFWIDSEQVEVDEADLTGAAPSGGAASLKKALGK